jgi:hypothetical protein
MEFTTRGIAGTLGVVITNRDRDEVLVRKG